MLTALDPELLTPAAANLRTTKAQTRSSYAEM